MSKSNKTPDQQPTIAEPTAPNLPSTPKAILAVAALRDQTLNLLARIETNLGLASEFEGELDQALLTADLRMRQPAILFEKLALISLARRQTDLLTAEVEVMQTRLRAANINARNPLLAEAKLQSEIRTNEEFFTVRNGRQSDLERIRNHHSKLAVRIADIDFEKNLAWSPRG